MKRILLAILVTLGIISPLLFVSPNATAAGVFSGCVDSQGQQQAAGSAFCSSQAQTGNPLTGTNGVLYKVTKIIASIGAVVAVLMMIAGGIMYLVANGDSGKITTAKNTIIYAAVGLVVIGLGGAIVALILNVIG